MRSCSSGVSFVLWARFLGGTAAPAHPVSLDGSIRSPIGRYVLEAPDPESHRHDDGEEEAAMGFAITIGHAEEIETGDSEIPSYLGVRTIEREDAPAFDLDEHTGRTNRREVSYVAWDRFCRRVGLH